LKEDDGTIFDMIRSAELIPRIVRSLSHQVDSPSFLFFTFYSSVETLQKCDGCGSYFVLIG
jgi:hypothetical protein